MISGHLAGCGSRQGQSGESDMSTYNSTNSTQTVESTEVAGEGGHPTRSSGGVDPATPVKVL